MRETIILSDLDLKLMNFLLKERIITDILNNFNIGLTDSKRHINRLKNLNILEIKKIGTFKKVKLNNKGKKILEILK